MTQLQDSNQILDISFAYKSIVLNVVIKMSPVVLRGISQSLDVGADLSLHQHASRVSHPG